MSLLTFSDSTCEDALGQARVLDEVDGDAAGELVVLAGRVLLHVGDELVGEGRAHGAHPVVVGRGHAQHEAIGRENAVACDDRGLRVEFAAECARELDRLQPRPEGLGESTVDGALETLLEVVQYAHRSPDPARVTMRMLVGPGVRLLSVPLLLG